MWYTIERDGKIVFDGKSTKNEIKGKVDAMLVQSKIDPCLSHVRVFKGKEIGRLIFDNCEK